MTLQDIHLVLIATSIPLIVSVVIGGIFTLYIEYKERRKK